MEKLQSFLSQRACGCWKQAEKAVKLGPSETREENIILKECPLSHSLLQEVSETGNEIGEPIIGGGTAISPFYFV